MISGAHVIVYSKDPDADRALLRDVFQLGHADAGGGFLIFALPPAEVAVHPSDENDRHELYFICDDVEAFVAEMASRGIACDAVTEQRWGRLTNVALPGGGKLGVYEPRHPRPEPAAAAAKPARKPPAKKKPKAPAKKTAAKKTAARPKPRRR